MGILPFDKRITIGARLFKSKREYFSFFNKSENQLLLSIHSLNDQTVEKYVQKIEEFKPVFMQGHPSAFYFISEWIKKRNYSLNTKIKAIFTTGETLYEDQREIIEHSFKCIVLQNYGQGESVVGAIECPLKSGYHEVSELGLIEVLRNPATGQSEIVGTSLWNTVFPFIRYRIEDTVIAAEKNQCACGINLPLKIKTVLGRNDDIISDYSGDIVFPVTIRMLIKPFLKTSENYQFRQIDSGKYQLLLLTDSVGEFRAKGLEENLKKTLGNAAFLSIEEVKEIRSPSGKVRNIIRLNA